MAPIGGRPRQSLWVGGLFVISFLSLSLATGFEIEGLLRIRKERVELHEWPAVVARVEGCFLDRYYPFQADFGGVIYSVRCRFTYSINGVVYESSVESRGKHHSLRNPAQLPEDAIQMESWAKRHKKGSLQVIHYDRANPARISLAGADDDIRSDTAVIALMSAKQAAILAAALLLLAWLTRRLSRRGEKVQDCTPTVQ